MNFKPFYVKYKSVANKQEAQDILDAAVVAGACPEEAFTHVITWHTYAGYYRARFLYFGVDYLNDTLLCNDVEQFGEGAVELTPDQVPAHLGIGHLQAEVVQRPNQQQWRNIKIRIKNKKHSCAFQEAAFENGCSWKDLPGKQYITQPYLFIDNEGVITYCGKGLEEYFNTREEQVEVTFEYEHKLTYTLEVVPKPDVKTIDYNGKIYPADEHAKLTEEYLEKLAAIEIKG